MKNLTLHFLRHGETELTRTNVYCGAGLDPGLTEAGHAMARAFADHYKNQPCDGIYVSPQLRTRQTAVPICAARGVEPTFCAGLKEIAYGQWEGLSLAEIERDFPDDYRRWVADPATHAPTGGGDPAVAIARRALRVIEEIQTQNPEGGDVLLISHKATIRIALCALLGIDLGQFRNRLSCPIGSVSVVEFTKRGPMLLTLADRRHLGEKTRNDE